MEGSKFELMNDENVILKSQRGDLMITNYRIRQLHDMSKQPSFTSMLLSDVTTVTSQKVENSQALVFSAILFVGGLFVAGSTPPN